MKKFFILMSLLILFSGISSVVDANEVPAVQQKTTVQWDSEAALKRVNTIGQKILKANSLPSTIQFKVSAEDHVNAYANIDKEVYVYKGLLEYVNDDNELAAVIAHELGHIINGHCAKQTIVNSAIVNVGNKIKTETTAGALSLAVAQNLVSAKVSRSDEFEADLTGADLLVKAGYNPLASVSVLNKICGNYFDLFQTHPSGEKRLMNIYDYVDYNYNNYTKLGYNSDSFEAAKKIILVNVNERTKNSSKVAKFKKQQEKLKTKKNKREAKILSSGAIPWEKSYNLMRLMAQ